MKFAAPEIFLYTAWIVPVMALFYVWAARKENRLLQKFARSEVLLAVLVNHDRSRKYVMTALNIAAIILIVVSLARPQWGMYWKFRESKGRDILFAVDVSRSMLATDMPPDRLEFAKQQVGYFVRRLEGDRVGLIAFAGEAFIQCPLTRDYSGFLLALNSLNTDTIPLGGSSIPEAVRESVRGYEGAETGRKVLIIITDGENTEGDLDAAIKEAGEQGIMISCIGIGSEEGQLVPIVNEEGKTEYLKDDAGHPVRSKLMAAALKKLAAETGGIYVRATGTDFGLDRIYAERIGDLEEKRVSEKMEKAYREQFQIPLMIAFAMLIYSFFMRMGAFLRKGTG